MNIINYTKQLAKIHLEGKDIVVENEDDVVKVLQSIIDTTEYPHIYNINYFKSTYTNEITNKLKNKESGIYR